MAADLNLHVTLWPTFKHFPYFLSDPRVSGIRLNSAMIEAAEIDPAMLGRIKADAVKIRAQSKVFVVIGIGGSYLGARAVIDCLSHPFLPLVPR